MFSRFKKPEGDAAPRMMPSAAAHGAMQGGMQGGMQGAMPARAPLGQPQAQRSPAAAPSAPARSSAPMAPSAVAHLAAAAASSTLRSPVEIAAADKEKKRKERMSQIKQDLHKRLLDSLNLAALDQATEANLKSEISAITAEALEEMSISLAKDERQTMIQDLYDEVMGLGPLEALLRDESVSDILVNGPNRVFIERGGKLTLSDVTFKDERHLLRIIDKIVSAVGRRVDESRGGPSISTSLRPC
jgi:pilus assembly protein CpaF